MRAFGSVIVNTVGYKLCSGRLTNGNEALLVVNRIIEQKCWRYLISMGARQQPILSSATTWLRGEVENLSLVAKQPIGWDDYQMRDLFVVARHLH